jgi:hypothetical protein
MVSSHVCSHTVVVGDAIDAWMNCSELTPRWGKRVVRHFKGGDHSEKIVHQASALGCDSNMATEGAAALASCEAAVSDVAHRVDNGTLPACEHTECTPPTDEYFDGVGHVLVMKLEQMVNELVQGRLHSFERLFVDSVFLSAVYLEDIAGMCVGSCNLYCHQLTACGGQCFHDHIRHGNTLSASASRRSTSGLRCGLLSRR